MYIRDGTIHDAGGLSSFDGGLGQVRLRLSVAVSRLDEIRQLQRNPARDPIRQEVQRIRAATGVAVDANPYFGLTQQHLEAVLRASEESIGAVRQPPEVLLALWSKEGSLRARFRGVQVPDELRHLMAGGTITSANNARVLTRSFLFWTDLGTDHFSFSPPGAADNRPVLNDSTVTSHERVYTAAVRQLESQGFLAPGVGAGVTNALAVTNLGSNRFTVTPSLDFYVGAMKLAGAFFSSLQAVTFPALGGSRPSAGLNYVQWNMGTAKFNQFLQSAEGHRRRSGHPSIEQWALRTRPQPDEWPVPRTNAIKFDFLVGAYAKLFPPIGDFPMPSGSTRMA